MWCWSWIIGVSLAAEPAQPVSGVPPVVEVPDVPEYQRLSQEIEKLVARNAWAGVERNYALLLETHVQLSFEDHLAGAHSARAVGNVTEARKRLLLANAIREERVVLDWLWDIDSHYNRVMLACDIGKHELEIAEMPFDPNQRLAIEFAQRTLSEVGEFDGYLPQGRYLFGGTTVSVEPRVQSMAVDLRTEKGIREREQMERKAEKERLKQAEQDAKDKAAP